MIGNQDLGRIREWKRDSSERERESKIRERERYKVREFEGEKTNSINLTDWANEWNL